MSDDGYFKYLGVSRMMSELEGRAAAAETQQELSADDIVRLERRVTALSRELSAMKVVIEVLSRALVETTGLDPGVLDARLEEALASPESAPTTTGPVVCDNCRLSYPAVHTVVTALGTFCKRCRAIAG